MAGSDKVKAAERAFLRAALRERAAQMDAEDHDGLLRWRKADEAHYAYRHAYNRLVAARKAVKHGR